MKQILTGDAAKTKLLIGINAVCDAVKVTAGPRGRTVILCGEWGVAITKDGVTVAKGVEVEDDIESIGAMLVKEVAVETVQEAGDGTTTAVILAQAMMTAGIKWIKDMGKSINPSEIKRGMDSVVSYVLKFLQDNKTDVGENLELLRQIALVSANGDEEVATLIHDAYKEIGKDGRLLIEESNGGDTYTKETNGFEFGRGFISSEFINDTTRGRVFYESPVILVCDHGISSLDSLIKTMEKCHHAKQTLVVIAQDISGDALKGLVLNNKSGVCKSVAIKAPYAGEQQREFLQDLCALTGAVMIAENSGGFKNQAAELSLGKCASILVTAELTTVTLIEDAVSGIRRYKSLKDNDLKTIKNDKPTFSDKIVEHLKSIMFHVEHGETPSKQEYYKQRLARATSSVSVIYVGATTTKAMREKKDRVDDAVKAVRCAIEEGVVPGGATMYLRALQLYKDTVYNVSRGTESFGGGELIVMEALVAPFRQLCNNSGMASVAVETFEEVVSGKVVFDFKDLKPVAMADNKIIDPAKVERIALENAASITATFLETDIVCMSK